MGMARVVIIGASKGIGLETTRQALEAGHMVRAFARSAADISISDPKLEKVRGNALRSNDVAAAVKGTNAVIQALGVGLGDLFGPVHLFSDATRILVAAMQAQGVKRLISVTEQATVAPASTASSYCHSGSFLAAPTTTRMCRNA
jgi:putative NADH-flavin reductase